MILKVKQNENPYDVIGNYIEKHISVIDNIIAVISINGKICNELFLVEISSTSNFVWQTDWWEGEENVELIDFFFVSDACKEDDNNDLISRQAAIDTVVFECGEWTGLASEISKQLRQLPSAEPKRGKWIKKHRHYGGFRSYTGFDAMGEQHTITVDERTEYDDFYCSECGTRSADISLNFCAKCGADMRGELNETY